MAKYLVCVALFFWLSGGLTQKALPHLENEHVRLSFVSTTRDGKPSARPVVKIRTPVGWVEAPLEASAESYQVSSAPPSVNLEITTSGFHPQWIDRSKPNAKASQVIWSAGTNHEAILSSVTPLDAHRLRLRFQPLAEGSLEAIWSLAPHEKSIQVSLEFTPTQDGQFSLGYFLFNRKPIEQVEELLLPMLVQRRRFPAKDYTLLETQCPTPVSLMQVGALVWAVSGDRTSAPAAFPVPAKSHYGLHLRNPQGEVQPSIFGPLLGTPEARTTNRQHIKFTFRILVQSGDWYAGYRTVADEVFGWRDYRQNGRVSLTEAALNLIDLYKDDVYGGWWERAKAPYQVESKNGATQSSPLTAVSLYYLTGDTELYQRRALPTLEFLLSRDGPHFSPVPAETGGYPKGSMSGPVRLFGGAVYGGLWEMMNRRTSAFHDIAFPNNTVRLNATQPNVEAHMEKRFLEAAAKGAHLVMTGMWTQPTPGTGQVTIHPGADCHGDKLHLLLHKGADEFRLGWPRKPGDTPEKKRPAWLVSPVGLGFEQPTTYTYKDNGGRMIFQAPV